MTDGDQGIAVGHVPLDEEIAAFVREEELWYTERSEDEEAIATQRLTELALGLSRADVARLFTQHEHDLPSVDANPESDARFSIVRELLWVGDDTDPEVAWTWIGHLIEDLDDEEALGLLAAGALEDFVREYGLTYVDRLVVAARTSARWRRALQWVWGWTTGSIDPEVRRRLEPYIGTDLF